MSNNMEGVIPKVAPIANYTAAANLAVNTLVKLDTTAGQMANAGAGDLAIGVIYDSFSSGDLVTAYPLTPGSRHYVVASAAIVAGDLVKCAASGKVAPEASTTTPTAFTIGQAETAASGNGVGFWMIVL